LPDLLNSEMDPRRGCAVTPYRSGGKIRGARPPGS